MVARKVCWPNPDRIPAGSNGLLVAPYFEEGAYRPTCRKARGIGLASTKKTLRPAHFARAAMEGDTRNELRDCADWRIRVSNQHKSGPPAAEAKSKILAPDHGRRFNTEVVTLKVSEGARLGSRVAGPVVLAFEPRRQSFPQ
jgi:sugar (pentulose or hexulose) kinase